jgi:hypothetical protein
MFLSEFKRMGLLLARLIIPVHRPGIILSSSLSQLVSSTSRFLGKIHDPIIFRRFVWEPKRFSVTLSHTRLRLRIDRCQVGSGVWTSSCFFLLFGRGPSQGQQPASKSHRNVGALIFSPSVFSSSRNVRIHHNQHARLFGAVHL